MKYRAHIDGLRAIAILLVLIYHGGLALFPAGFIGVDVFFVISGFLITSIIHQALEKKTFSFLDFYARRLWRLQPVYITLLLVATLIGFYSYLPDDLIQYTRSARKAALFISNLHYMQTTTGYFSPDSHQLPLLHTWSLSIEWQCYLMLPVMMYGLHRVVKTAWLPWVVYGLTLGCLMLTLYLSDASPALVYYQFLARMFEFLMGACVAIDVLRSPFQIQPSDVHPHPQPFSQREKGADRGKALRWRFGWVSLLLIFLIATKNQLLLGYPNGYALLVCLSVAYLIALGEHRPNAALIRLLSWKPLVFIGLLSYSLYIWHWLVFSMMRYHGIKETMASLTCAYVITFVVAYCSWRLIETPARRYHGMKFQNTFACLFIFPIVFTHLASYWVKTHDGLPQRFDQELVTIYQQLRHYTSTARPTCIDRAQPLSACMLGSTHPHARHALMIGDSFSNHYWGFMDTLGKAAKVQILAQGTSSCLTLPGIYQYNWWHYKDRVYQDCYDHTKQYYALIQKKHYDFVVLGQIWSNYFHAEIINHLDDKRTPALSETRTQTALEEAIRIIIHAGARPVIIKQTALMQEDFHACFFKHVKLRTHYDPEQCNFNLTLNEADHWFDGLFQKMQNKYPQLIVIDPKKVQCPSGRCVADIKGVPVYRDVGHLTDYASYQFGEIYLQRYENPLG